MTPEQIAANHKLYDRRKLVYRHRVYVARGGQKLRPEHFVRAHPEVDFVYIPLEHEFVWMFLDEEDRAIFHQWAESGPKSGVGGLSVSMLFVGDKL